jgi:predicted transcriptional regulator
MVLSEANVAKGELAAMMSSLNRAYQQVVDAAITLESDQDIKRAWDAIKKNQHEQFLVLLEQAAKKFVLALDGWERARNK